MFYLSRRNLSRHNNQIDDTLLFLLFIYLFCFIQRARRFRIKRPKAYCVMSYNGLVVIMILLFVLFSTFKDPTSRLFVSDGPERVMKRLRPVQCARADVSSFSHGQRSRYGNGNPRPHHIMLTGADNVRFRAPLPARNNNQNPFARRVVGKQESARLTSGRPGATPLGVALFGPR